MEDGLLVAHVTAITFCVYGIHSIGNKGDIVVPKSGKVNFWRQCYFGHVDVDVAIAIDPIDELACME
jgi:hypothetical protein